MTPHPFSLAARPTRDSVTQTLVDAALGVAELLNLDGEEPPSADFYAPYLTSEYTSPKLSYHLGLLKLAAEEYDKHEHPLKPSGPTPRTPSPSAQADWAGSWEAQR